MKLRLCAGCLSLLFLLSGCTSMLERSYTLVQPHTQPVTQENGSALEAQSYQQLVSAVLYLVTRHSEDGIIRLYNYTGNDVESDVTRACLEVVQKDPLGAFAVDYIKHDVTQVVTFYEAQISISYLRTAEEMSRVTAVTGSSAIKNELRDALSRLETTRLLRISYYAEENDFLYELVRQAYYDTPLSAFGMPEISVSLYPESGIQRIVEINLTYPEESDILLRRQQQLADAAARLLSDHPADDPNVLYELLLSHTSPTEDGFTAYAALVDGFANEEGLALAYKLLCDQVGLTCTVVQGDGDRKFWNIVSTANGSRHVDCAAGLFGLTDMELEQLGGYQWSDSYPLCRDGSQSPAF